MLRSLVVDAEELTYRAFIAHKAVCALPLDERLAHAISAATRLEEHADEIVELHVEELGAPIRFARREVESAVRLLLHLPVFADALRPQIRGVVSVSYEPYGVVFGWHAANSPVWVPTLVSASAFVAGNALIARPSRRAETTTRRVLELLSEDWPAHAVQIIEPGTPPEVAEALITHSGVHAVVCHGSTATCKRHLARLGRAYETGSVLRPYIPEASGNDAFVVLAGADLDAAAEALALAAFANGGQLCMAAKRIICERDVWPEFKPRIERAVFALVLGAPEHPLTDIAPLPAGPARRSARAMLAEALAFGGQIVVGSGEDGPFVTPTIVELPRDGLDAELWTEECFAPIRGLVLADNPDDAAELAGGSRYGLGVAIFGPLEVATELAAKVRTARVLINTSPLLQDPELVVGGVGDSGVAGARPKLEQLVFTRRTHVQDQG
jgi:acyl-CoA reductase-like NAD-dependent aldehyde dehydrogenase